METETEDMILCHRHRVHINIENNLQSQPSFLQREERAMDGRLVTGKNRNIGSVCEGLSNKIFNLFRERLLLQKIKIKKKIIRQRSIKLHEMQSVPLCFFLLPCYPHRRLCTKLDRSLFGLIQYTILISFLSKE